MRNKLIGNYQLLLLFPCISQHNLQLIFNINKKNIISRITKKELEETKGGKTSTLTKGERMGLESLKKRIKEGEIVVVETDKSGKFSVMNQDEYLQAGDLHVVNDRKHSRTTMRILKV